MKKIIITVLIGLTSYAYGETLTPEQRQENDHLEQALNQAWQQLSPAQRQSLRQQEMTWAKWKDTLEYGRRHQALEERTAYLLQQTKSADISARQQAQIDAQNIRKIMNPLPGETDVQRMQRVMAAEEKQWAVEFEQRRQKEVEERKGFEQRDLDNARRFRAQEQEAARERQREMEARYAIQSEEEAADKEAVLQQEKERQASEARMQADQAVRHAQYKAEEEFTKADQAAKMREAQDKLSKAGVLPNGKDGCFGPAEEFIKANMNNPASYQFVNMVVIYFVPGGSGSIKLDAVPAITDNCYIHIYVSYRGNNPYGALVFDHAHIIYNPATNEMRMMPQS